MTRARGRKVNIINTGATFLHKSCKHINNDGEVVIFNEHGLVTIRRPADRREQEMCAPLERLCLDNQ